MNKKTYLFIFLVIIILLFGFWFWQSKEPVPAELESIAEIVRSKECLTEGVEGEYKSCQVDLEKQNDAWLMTIFYDGYFDDSVKAGKIQSLFKLEEGEWVMVENEILYQCQPNRGHQDFSTEACI